MNPKYHAELNNSNRRWDIVCCAYKTLGYVHDNGNFSCWVEYDLMGEAAHNELWYDSEKVYNGTKFNKISEVIQDQK